MACDACASQAIVLSAAGGTGQPAATIRHCWFVLVLSAH